MAQPPHPNTPTPTARGWQGEPLRPAPPPPPPPPARTSTSPGTTGLRHRQLSTPPKKKLFCCAASAGSIITMPPSCARASTCNTPGGDGGKGACMGWLAPRLACAPARPPARPPVRTWHDCALGKVAGEKVVVHGHALVADRVLAILPLEHAVHQQEGVPAGERMVWGRAGLRSTQRRAPPPLPRQFPHPPRTPTGAAICP